MKFLFLSLFFQFAFYGFSQGLVINEVVSSNYISIADEDGDFVDWIELYNNSSIDINLDGYFLSDDSEESEKWIFPSVTVHSNDFLMVFASGKNRLNTGELHTNFKIKSSGEPLILYNNSNVLIDEISLPALLSDQSYGRLNDGTVNLGIISNATPGMSNNTESLLKEVTFSKSSGFHASSFELSITCSDSVFYTLDGSKPNLNSNFYSSAFTVSKPSLNNLSLVPTTPLAYDPDIWPNREYGFQVPEKTIRKAVIVRAIAFKNGVQTSLEYHKTYFMQEEKYTFPVISLITDSLALFDFDEGIYIPGKYLNENNEGWTGNYFKRGINWEKVGHVEWFEDGKLEFSEPVGFRISGQKSRSSPQKSIRLYFRGEYGRSSLKKSIFKDRDYEEYKRLTLRSSFTYWWGRNSLFQDDFIHSIASNKNFDLDVQMSAPSILFINGEYWGIHNLRERQDKYYFESIQGAHKDSIDIVTGNLTAEQGSAESFLNLLDFIDKHDLSVESNYDHVRTLMDINNFIDYNIVETYFGNTDWPANNVRMWRRQNIDTNWRWLLYDLDAAVGNVNLNPFTKFKESDVPHARIYNALIKNETFKMAFISRYLYHLEQSFRPSVLLNVLETSKMKYASEVSEHIIRWQNPKTFLEWESHCDHLENFLKNRPCSIKTMLIGEFGLNVLGTFNCLYDQYDSFDMIKVYPNPNSGKFTMLLDIEGELGGIISIYNNLGQVVYTNAFSSVVQEFDLSFLANGVYTIHFYNEQLSATKKIVIQQ